MEIRMFQIFDDMNLYDIANGTRLIEIGNELVSAKKVKQGCTVTMGLPEYILHQLLDGSKIPIIVLVDKDDYFLRKNLSGASDDMPLMFTRP